ncbi:MAG: CHAP domain-containing protein [Candidatus Nomurabacteria bacterium]|jgi:surface antigen|nr:CHAP domain-containing protein [Candidatus Nomurabacteria bacterium]
MNRISDKIGDNWRALNTRKQRRILTVTYSAVLLVIFTTIGLNYQSPVKQSDGSGLQLSSSQNALINQVKESNLAVAAAQTASLSVANNVMERSISLATKEEMAQNDNTVISKPILSIDDSNNSITTYVTVDGDTAPSVASKFGISVQTVKWANNLITDLLGVGTTLTIPTVDGVVYTMKDGDNLNSVVDKYKGAVSEVLAVNNISDSVKTGDMIVIPNGILPQNERPGYTAPTIAAARPSSSVSYSNSAAMVGNRYSYGYCTWYAYNRRASLGRPIGSFWGNANTWDNRARAAGWTVSSTPIAVAVFQTDSGYYGHVGIVESVNSDGTINISDMNGIAGWNRVGHANNVSAGGYVFIY